MSKTLQEAKLPSLKDKIEEVADIELSSQKKKKVEIKKTVKKSK